MVELNEDGKKVEAELNKAGLSLRDACVSIGTLMDLGLIDRVEPVTAEEFRSILAARTTETDR